MINANELRIGNFVMTNNSKYRTDDVGKVACIVSIDSERSFEEIKGTASVYLIDDKWKETYGQWLTFYEPITITEEWLYNFGFSEGFDWESGNYTNNLDLSFVITYNEDTKDFSISKYLKSGFTGSRVVITNAIKYVHQLQNLYFALTQTELELKQ